MFSNGRVDDCREFGFEGIMAEGGLLIAQNGRDYGNTLLMCAKENIRYDLT